ncbi:hypothetical protein HGRIS_011343 [Hohenbuehelia grisea]|uniref:deuterolysin n=1 Tax=Hohenbuehelia grisea TaxID=104357 RepID=A0ABR3JUX7_9AGAR
MLVLSVLSLGLAGFASASPAAPPSSGGLSIKITGPGKAVKSVGELKFTAEVSNAGSEDVKVLKYGTVLDDKLPTRAFNVMKGDKKVAFKGVETLFSAEDADDSAYTVIPAGKSVSVTHQVATLYDFHAEGTGTFTFEAVSNFKVSPSAKERTSDTNALPVVQASTESVDVAITQDVGPRELTRRVTNFCPEGDNKTFIDASYQESKALSWFGLGHNLRYNGSDGIYQDYFGLNPVGAINEALRTIAFEEDPEIYTNCIDYYDSCASGVVGYWVPYFADVYYCKPFFHKHRASSVCDDDFKVNALALRAVWTFNLLSRGTFGLVDIQSSCTLSKIIPDEYSIYNAPSYACFLLEIFRAEVCTAEPPIGRS